MIFHGFDRLAPERPGHATRRPTMSRIFKSLPPQGTRLGIAFSGGLDTPCAVAWLTREGMQVHAYTADLAQPDEKDPATIPPIAIEVRPMTISASGNHCVRWMSGYIRSSKKTPAATIAAEWR